VAACPIISWGGQVSRFHSRRSEATDPGGSLVYPGRYHDGWAALYTCLRPEAAVGEFLRHSSVGALRRLAIMRLSRLSVQVAAILDCRDAVAMVLAPDELPHDTDYRVTQQIGAASVALGVEGILVPSATLLGDNIVFWVSQMRSTSRIVVVSSEDPRLYVPR
jgi:RES domain-containing protein